MVITYQEERDALLASPCVHDCLKQAIKVLDEKDPIDAMNNADTLAILMHRRVTEIRKRYTA